MNLDTMTYDEIDTYCKELLDEFGRALAALERAAEREKLAAKTQLHAGLKP